jgi:hypothetical protein
MADVDDAMVVVDDSGSEPDAGSGTSSDASMTDWWPYDSNTANVVASPTDDIRPAWTNLVRGPDGVVYTAFSQIARVTSPGWKFGAALPGGKYGSDACSQLLASEGRLYAVCAELDGEIDYAPWSDRRTLYALDTAGSLAWSFPAVTAGERPQPFFIAGVAVARATASALWVVGQDADTAVVRVLDVSTGDTLHATTLPLAATVQAQTPPYPNPHRTNVRGGWAAPDGASMLLGLSEVNDQPASVSVVTLPEAPEDAPVVAATAPLVALDGSKYEFVVSAALWAGNWWLTAWRRDQGEHGAQGGQVLLKLDLADLTVVDEMPLPQATVFDVVHARLQSRGDALLLSANSTPALGILPGIAKTCTEQMGAPGLWAWDVFGRPLWQRANLEACDYPSRAQILFVGGGHGIRANMQDPDRPWHVDPWGHRWPDNAPPPADLAPCPSLTLDDCDDGNPCTRDLCEPGVGCVNPLWEDGAPCGAEKSCLGGVCEAHP